MPDRKLTKVELKKFLSECESGKLKFYGLQAFLEEDTEPSLHDICIHELHASIDALKTVIIQQGRDIEVLKKEAKKS